MQRVDLAILFALEEEFEVFFSRITAPKDRRSDPRTGRAVFLFDWAVGSTAPYHCLTTFVGKMGSQDALLVTARILLSYSPANLALVGLAGSLADEILIGDVVIADQVTDYLQDAKMGKAS